MTMQAAEARRRQCWRCGAETAGALACPRCAVVQPLAAGTDLFAVLGLPRGLAVDAADLERRWHEASRAVHPDRHQTAGARERELSLAASAAVNRAYRTLCDPIALGRYWLELHGARLGEDNNQVPPALATEVFEAQEKLAELRAGGAVGDEVRALRDDLAARLDAMREELVARYADADASLPDLKRRLSEIAYLTTLLGDVVTSLGAA